MAAVCVFYSKTINRFYKGSCKEISYRLEQHLNKAFEGSYTSKVNDWELFYSIMELEYKQARSIEAHIKRMNSSIYIRNLKKYPEMTEKLKKRFK